MSRLTRDGTAEPVSRDQNLRHARGQGNVHFRCSADHEKDWQPYPVDPYSAICDDHTNTYTGRHSGTHPWYDHQRERKYGGAQSRNSNKEEFNIRSNHQLYSIK